MASELFVDNITGKTGTSGSAPITLSGDTVTLGSSATVPASVGSSMVLIKTITSSAGDTEILFQHGSNGVVIDSTYINYKILVTGLTVTTDSKHVYLNIGNSSGYDTANRGGINYWYDNGSSRGANGTHLDRGYTWDTRDTMHNDSTNGGLQGYFNFYNLTSANHATHTTFQVTYLAANGYYYGYDGGSTTVDATAFDRIKFSTNSDSFQAGAKLSLYGIKDA